MTDFWTKRKKAVEREEEIENINRLAAEEEARLAEHHEVLSEKSDDEILEELGLPQPEEMAAGDDFKAFMRETVPAHLRQRALRRLWLSNPILANVDGLVDYGQDFTDAAVGAGAVETTYQVGRGMLEHIEEMARQAEEAERKAKEALMADEDAEQASGSEEIQDAPEDVECDEGAAADKRDDLEMAKESALDVDEDVEEQQTHGAHYDEMFDEVAPPQSFRPRRMRFSIEEANV